MGFDDLTTLISASGAAAAAAGGVLWAVYSRCLVRVPPNRALVLYGRRSSRRSVDPGVPPSGIDVNRPRILVGGGVFIAPWNKGVGRISLDPVLVEASVRSMHSLEGARASGWEVRLQIQVKVPAEPGSLARAAESLLGKTDEEIQTLIRRTVEAAVPSVLSRLRSESAGPDWDTLAAEIQASVAPDLLAWGFLVRTLSVTELRRILPVESSTSLSPAKPAPVSAAPVDRSKTSTLLGSFHTRLARAEWNLGIVSAAVARMYRESTGSEPGALPVSVLDIPLGYEVPSSVVSTEDPLDGLHESTEGDRSPPTRLASVDEPTGEGGRDSQPPLD